LKNQCNPTINKNKNIYYQRTVLGLPIFVKLKKATLESAASIYQASREEKLNKKTLSAKHCSQQHIMLHLRHAFSA
jgi:hypothetical protein